MNDQAGRRYVAALTGMRGVAACLVFLYHYAALHPGIRLDQAVPVIGAVLHFPFGFGFAGVDIFFVLSGFLLTLPFARHAIGNGPRPKLPRYFRRRLQRVFPAYYAQLLILLLAGSWFVTWKPLAMPDFVAHLLMFFNIGWAPVQPMVGVWWTLPVELGFYLVLPLLAPLLRPARWIVALAVGIAISVLYRFWAAAHFGPMGSDHGGLVLPAVWLWQVVLGAGADYWQGHWSMLVSPVALGLPLSIAVASLYWGCRIGTWLLANHAVYFLGLISYSLYLWHFVVMQQVQVLIGESYSRLPHWVTFPVAAASVIAVATASYYLIERPFYRLQPWRKVLRQRSKPGE